MSHTDDPTLTTPIEGTPISEGQFPDVTQRDFLESIKLKTGKTEAELSVIANDSVALNALMTQYFDETSAGAGNAAPSQSVEDKTTGNGTVPDVQPDDEKEEVVSVKPSLLKPYGNTLKEAIANVIQKAREGNDTVEIFKTRTIPSLENEIRTRDSRYASVSEENEALKKSLDELRSKSVGTSVPANDTIKLPDLPVIPKDFDPFDEDSRSQFTKALSVLMERDKIMSDRLTAPKELATEQKDVPAVRPTVIHNQNEETQRRQNEFAAVRAIQNSPAFADALRTPRDIEAINNDYITFGVNLAAMVGVQKPIDDSGLFTPDTQRVIGLFLDQTSPEGEKLRSAAKGNGIVAPSNEELTSLRRITKIRSVQKNRFAADGRGGFTPISTEEAFAIAQREAPQLFTVKSAIDERRADQERMQKAVENRSKFTTDVPPSVGADMSNLLKASIDDFVRVIAKPQSSWTVSEMALVKETMKASGLSDEEQKFWIENQKK